MMTMMTMTAAAAAWIAGPLMLNGQLLKIRTGQTSHRPWSTEEKKMRKKEKKELEHIKY
jgi:hypothetical protein